MTNQPDNYYTIQPGDIFHSLAQLCYRDRNKWMTIRQANFLLGIFGPDQPLPAGLHLTLPFIPELTTTILTEEGDTLRALAKFFYFSEGQWMTIRQANPPLQGIEPDQPLPVGLQLTLPFIPERTIILITNEGDTLHTFAKTYFDDENQWKRFGEVNPPLRGIESDQPLPAGLQLTLPFIPDLRTAVLTEEGDTLHALAKFFYNDENQWPRIRQANPLLQGFGPDQPLPVGLQLTLPSLPATRVIITEKGDTFRALAQTYYHNEDQWPRIRQLNPPLQGFGPDEPLPTSFQLTLTLFARNKVEQSYTTVSNDTLTSIARHFYNGNASKWTVIRQHNANVQRYNANDKLPSGLIIDIP